MNRNDLPRWANRIVDHIADSPMSIVGRIAAARLGRPTLTGGVAVTVFDDREKRLLIAPMNYSGQGRAWASALEASSSSISARNMAVDVPGGFAFDADLVVPVATYHNDSDWQRRQFAAAATATHVLIEAEEPPFGRLAGRSVEAQALALLDSGVDVAYMAHGTDVRLPSTHLKENPWSHYADPEIYAPRAETLAARNIALLERSERCLFVSTPDLLLDLPAATWCPVVVDPARWAAVRTDRAVNAPLRVAHAPSVSVVKGTELIMSTLESLADQGVISLDLITGVPSAQMPRAFAEADVVIDQMRIGSYGVAAVEAMAAGCVVVGHVSSSVRDLIRRQSGADLPIVEATPDTIGGVLRALADEGDLSTRREQGLEFVNLVHDGRRSARVLREQWIDPLTLDDRKALPDAPSR
ncbi:hypothetical protein [Microbacterium profundi]|uniref:hypothetical protein n=1 Tax=Microbacterium profundi TaxID=450380 RepID=UPI00068A3D63|nr:hypothetical protein [Microbacterium profundi]